MTLENLDPYLGDIDEMTARTGGGADEYVHPRLKHLGSVVAVVLRETVAPAAIRNSEAEVTEILDLEGTRRVRAVANKFKYGERSRGLQILRHFGVGGTMPQNRTEVPNDGKPSSVFDLNTVVFGDSANHGNRVLPVRAAGLYSDALSTAPYAECVDDSFHNRNSEDGTLFDAKEKKNSEKIFDRHYVIPGTHLVQTIAFNGRTAPRLAIEHWLASVGFAGPYGGQTSVYGVNIRNHMVGIFASKLERDTSSPYVILQRGNLSGTRTPPQEICEAVSEVMKGQAEICLTGTEVSSIQKDLVERIEKKESELVGRYEHGSAKIAEYFDAWFGAGPKKGKGRKSK